MGSFTSATVVSPPRSFPKVWFETIAKAEHSLLQERTRSARDFGSSWAMHEFERFGRTSDRGTPIHTYRTTHITHTYGDFLGSASLPRFISRSYGLPGLRSIVFLFHLLHLFLNLLLSTYTNLAGMGYLGIDCAPGLDGTDRHISTFGSTTWHLVTCRTKVYPPGLVRSGSCTAVSVLPFSTFFLSFSRLPTLSGILRSL